MGMSRRAWWRRQLWRGGRPGGKNKKEGVAAAAAIEEPGWGEEE